MPVGEPPKTAATTGSSTGSYGLPATDSTVRSAFLPGVRLPTSSSRPSARAASRVARRSAPVASSASGRCSRARLRYDGRAQLLPDVERRRRRRRVGAEPDADAGRPQAGERRGAAAEQRVRARAVRDRDVAGCASSCDLVVVEVDAVRAEKLGPEHVRERRHRALARRLDEHGAIAASGPGARDEPFVLGGALGEVRADRDAEREAPAVDVERAGVRRVRRDADADELALGRAQPQLLERRARSAPGRRRTPRGRRSRAARARPRPSPTRRRSCSRPSS